LHLDSKDAHLYTRLAKLANSVVDGLLDNCGFGTDKYRFRDHHEKLIAIIQSSNKDKNVDKDRRSQLGLGESISPEVTKVPERSLRGAEHSWGIDLDDQTIKFTNHNRNNNGNTNANTNNNNHNNNDRSNGMSRTFNNGSSPDKYTYRGVRSQMKSRTLTEDEIVARLVARKRHGQLQQSQLQNSPHYSMHAAGHNRNGIPLQHLLSSEMLTSDRYNPHRPNQTDPHALTLPLPSRDEGDSSAMKSSLRDQLRAGLKKFSPKGQSTGVEKLNK